MFESLKKSWNEMWARQHAWRMKNHRQEDRIVYNIDEIGMLKFFVVFVAEMIVFFSVYGLILIARWLILGV